jgi:hypothetical protein
VANGVSPARLTLRSGPAAVMVALGVAAALAALERMMARPLGVLDPDVISVVTEPGRILSRDT